MLKDYVSFAWRNLTHKKLRSWLTLIGIFIGVTSVVALIGLGDGLQAAITSQFGISATNVISVQAGGATGQGPPGTGVVNPLTRDDVEAIRRLSNVDTAIGRVIEQVRMDFRDGTRFTFVSDLPTDENRRFVEEVIELDVAQGRALRPDERGKVFLGYNYGVREALFGRVVRVGDTITVQGRQFEVVGISARKGSFIFDNILLMNDHDVIDLLPADKKDDVNVIAVLPRSGVSLDLAREDIERLMRRRRNVREGNEDFQVSTPEATLAQVNQVLTGVQVFVVMIAMISILIGSIGIVNTMTTSVIERRKQIGIMKAIGAKNRDIFYQFFIESGMMGLMGGIVGVIVGQTISYSGTVALNTFIGSTASPTINYGLIIFTLIGSFTIGAISGIVPALQAARQKPVDALRD
ncbi:MAG: ABC transporter permease [Candidatus Woesearchaeota archaeon]